MMGEYVTLFYEISYDGIRKFFLIIRNDYEFLFFKIFFKIVLEKFSLIWWHKIFSDDF